MRQTRITMGMPAIVEIVAPHAHEAVYDAVFAYFDAIDAQFSTYKHDSEVARINRGELALEECSEEMREVFALAKETAEKTAGFFAIYTPDGALDPSGLVKGWAIQKAAEFLRAEGYTDFYIEIAGDIQADGQNAEGEEWTIGIRNPFNRDEIVKAVHAGGKGIATSGTYARGAHIYDPHRKQAVEDSLVSLTVIGPDVYEADRMATAAFAMGPDGLLFLEELPGFEAYGISSDGTAALTSGFLAHTVRA